MSMFTQEFLVKVLSYIMKKKISPTFGIKSMQEKLNLNLNSLLALIAERRSPDIILSKVACYS